MPEERGLYPRMRIRDQLVHFARLSGLSSGAAQEATARWLMRFGLGERAGSRLDELSHGNQQRIGLIWLAGRVYSGAILRIGKKVGLREAWRAAG